MKNFKSNLILLLLLFSQLSLKSQNSNVKDYYNYEPQYCVGAIPSILNQSSSSKAKEATKNIKSTNAKRSEKKTEIDHAVESSFFEDQLLTSGQILYGDPMSEFVNQVADELLTDKKQLRDELQFFVMKSHVPNAYTTHNGIVVVTIGLLARLENESQLAVILAHEIQHYVLKHSLQQYKEVRQTISESKSRRNNSDVESKIKHLYRFSKDQELEADKMGYELIKNSKYDLSEGIYVFEMLKFSDFPFLETTMKIESFETPYYKYPTHIIEGIAKKLKDAVAEDEKTDKEELNEETSTHPSLDKRINILKNLVDQKNFSGNKKFVVGQKEFEEIQKMSRFELLILFIRRGDYGRSFYLSSVVEILYGKGNFIDKVRAMSLYGILEHKIKKHDLADYGCGINQNRGDWRPITAAIETMDSKDFGAFASKLIYDIYADRKQDSFISKLTNRTFQLIQNKLDMNLKDFLNFKPQDIEAAKQNTDTSAVITDGKLKNPRSRITRTSGNEIAINAPYYTGIFYSVTDKKTLESYFNSVEQSYSSMGNPKKETYASKAEREKRRYLYSNKNISSITLLEPKFSYSLGRITGYGNDIQSNRNYYLEEITKKNIIEQWKFVSNSVNQEIQIVNNSVSKTLKTEDLNNYSRMNDWLSERLNNDTGQMILFYSQYLNFSGNHKYLGWVGYDYTEVPRPFDPLALFYTLYFPVYFPFYLAQQLQNDCYFNQKVLVYNTETGRQIYNHKNMVEHKIKEDFLRAQIYNTIYEIKHVEGK